jgi:hypothetical protein
MCDYCASFDDELYPDLGDEGNFLSVDHKNAIIGMNIDSEEEAVRIAQKRTVTYAGEKGVETREETQCVYIPLPLIHDIMHALAEANNLLVAKRILQEKFDNFKDEDTEADNDS